MTSHLGGQEMFKVSWENHFLKKKVGESKIKFCDVIYNQSPEKKLFCIP